MVGVYERLEWFHVNKQRKRTDKIRENNRLRKIMRTRNLEETIRQMVSQGGDQEINAAIHVAIAKTQHTDRYIDNNKDTIKAV